ncbi:MAG: hypothetical protein KBA85_11215 [Chloroflexi bacterium]|nr:hypothetical protein [Chloroflexota bacterium]
MKRIYWLLTFVLLFTLVLAACGGSEEAAPTEAAPAAVEESGSAPESEAATAVPTPIPAPTEAPVPTEAPEPTAEPAASIISFADLNPLGKPADLNSYRNEMILTMSGTNAAGELITQTISMQMAFTTDPAASSVDMMIEGAADMADMGAINMVQIGDTNYMVIPQMGCVTLPAEGESLLDNSMTQEFSPESMFGTLENLTLVGDDEIDGIPVRHYTFDETAVPEQDRLGIVSMNGHVYIAKDGGYLVSMVSDIQGDSTFLEGFEGNQDAVMHMEFRTKDINQPFEIVPPAECEGQTANAAPPFPALEDASDLVTFPGVMGYTTAVPLADAIAFYQNAMAEAGYTYSEDSSFISDQAASLTFNGEAGAVSVTLSETDGVTSVTILYDASQ